MFNLSPDQAFAAETALGGQAARQARAAIIMAVLHHDPALKAAVRADCQALAKAAAEQRGFADLADLTLAGYAQDFALEQAEIMAHAGRKTTAKRSVA